MCGDRLEIYWSGPTHGSEVFGLPIRLRQTWLPTCPVVEKRNENAGNAQTRAIDRRE